VGACRRVSTEDTHPGTTDPFRAAVRNGAGHGGADTLSPVSTRMLIVLALICGLAILVAFAVQAAQII
jgi:hypothetical protein